VKCRDAFVVSYTVKTSRCSSPHRVRRSDVAGASASGVELSVVSSEVVVQRVRDQCKVYCSLKFYNTPAGGAVSCLLDILFRAVRLRSCSHCTWRPDAFGASSWSSSAVVQVCLSSTTTSSRRGRWGGKSSQCTTGVRSSSTPQSSTTWSLVGRRCSKSCEESLVEFIYTSTGGSSVATTVVLSRGVRQSRVRAVQDVSTSPLPVRRHSQSVTQWCTVVCPAGGAVPRRRSSGSAHSGRSRVCVKKRAEVVVNGI